MLITASIDIRQYNAGVGFESVSFVQTPLFIWLSDCMHLVHQLWFLDHLNLMSLCWDMGLYSFTVYQQYSIGVPRRGCYRRSSGPHHRTPNRIAAMCGCVLNVLEADVTMEYSKIPWICCCYWCSFHCLHLWWHSAQHVGEVLCIGTEHSVEQTCNCIIVKSINSLTLWTEVIICQSM